MLEGLLFYKVQLLAGVGLGAALSFLGVFVVLRRFAVFGVTLSQAATAAVSLSLLLGLKGEGATAESRVLGDLLVLALTTLLMLPLYQAVLRERADAGSLLVLGLVVFAALSQTLLAFGGRVQNHLVQAFFGNVLTTAPADLAHLWVPALILAVLFVYFFRDLVAVAFDRDHARLSGVSVKLVEAFFFLALSYVVSEAINLMGTFYTLAQMIIPGLFALAIARSLPAALLIAMGYAAVMTVGGFLLSLVPVPVGHSPINLPTSSTIVLLLAAGFPLGHLIARVLPARSGDAAKHPN